MTGSNPRVAPDLVREHAAKLADLTDDVLFADVWERPGLSPRERSLITVAALVALGRDAQLTGHLRRGLDNGLTRDQLAEAITHLAFYAGWPADERRQRARLRHRPGREVNASGGRAWMALPRSLVLPFWCQSPLARLCSVLDCDCVSQPFLTSAWTLLS